MKYSKTASLIILVSLLTSSCAHINIMAQEEKCPILRGNFEYQGIVHEQKFRKKIIAQYISDETDPLYGIFGGYRHRLFLFCFDSCLDESEDIDQIVVLYGLGTLRNAPLYSFEFEETELGGVYGLNISHQNDIEWETLQPTVMNEASADYDEFHSAIYTLIINNTYLTHPEIYKHSGATLSLIYGDWETFGFREELENIIFADLTVNTGVVGNWQQINRDETVINGNFSTFGPTNPIFVDPQDENNTARWWPTYNIAIAQDIERTSLPRTHSFEISFSFIGILFGLVVFSAALVVIKFRRRVKK